jgi:two-component system alkaline phosphatase synthesis response regulator PhoP
MGMLDDLKTITKPPSSSPAPDIVSPRRIKKILVVEDEKVLADALEIKLKHEGYEVYKAENGQAGLELTKTVKPDLLLLDLMMPVMDGKTMLHHLREIPEFKTLPVVVLTNAGDVDNIRETQMYYNVNNFLIKSNVSTADIVKQVRDII